MLPPAVTVHGLADARRALAPGRPVTLLSAEGAGCFAGCGWWRALVGCARAQAPGIAAAAETPDVLDCAGSPGRAVEALRAGCLWVVLAPSCPAFADVADRAAALGARVLARRPASLDLGTLGGTLGRRRGARDGGPRASPDLLEEWLRRDSPAAMG